MMGVFPSPFFPPLAGAGGKNFGKRKRTGITSIGTYLPKYRISEKMINEAWGKPGGRSERTVGYFDEDSLSLGVSAALSCMDDQDMEKVEGLTFCSTTSPFKEKLASATTSMILNLPLALSKSSGPSTGHRYNEPTSA